MTVMRRRLTNEEREIRSGRGIPLHRWWPLPFMFLILMLISFDHPLFQRCLGISLDGRGRGGAIVGMVAAAPCSVFLLRGSPFEWILFAALWAPVPFAIRNHRWMKRHREYWDEARLREAQRRAEKHLALSRGDGDS